MRSTFLVLLGSASANLLRDARTLGVHPKIKKVVQLLNDMKATIDDDADADARVNEKMECWCKKNDKSLGEAQKAAQDRVKLLRSRVKANTARVAQKTTELVQCEKDIAKCTTDMEEERERNKKTVDELHAAEVELTEAITQMNNAIMVLSKHNTGLNQQKAIVSLKKHLKSHTDLLDSLLPNDRETVMGFLQQPAQIEPTAQKGGYNSQSGEIFGILNQMLETFESDLSSNKEEQASNKKFHDDNMSRMTEESETLDAKKNRLTSDKADANQQLADDNTEIADLEEKMGKDAEFLKIVKEKCPKHRQEYEKRVKERHLEIEAVDKAIGFLTSDEAFDTFGTMKAAQFVQVGMVGLHQKQAAQAILYAAARRNPHAAKLNLLGARMGLDSFTKVKKAIEQMVAELKQQRDDEREQKDTCVENLTSNEKDIKQSENELEMLTASLESKTLEKEEATKELASVVQGLADLKKSKEDLKEDRTAAIKAYQANMADNNAAIGLLQKAISALSYQYSKNSFVQQPGQSSLTHTAAPEMKGDYKKNSSGNVVLSMLNEVVNDAKEQIALLNEAEEQAKKDYDLEMETTNDQITSSTQAKTQGEFKVSALAETIEDLNSSAKEKTTSISLLYDGKKNLHMQCDFLLKNFDLRQDAISDEIEALHQVTAILSGAKVGAPEF